MSIKNELKPVKMTPTPAVRAVLSAAKKPMTYDDIISAIYKRYGTMVKRSRLHTIMYLFDREGRIKRERTGMLVTFEWVPE